MLWEKSEYTLKKIEHNYCLTIENILLHYFTVSLSVLKNFILRDDRKIVHSIFSPYI